ncbi:tetratricopeptide repeat protein [Nostoc sp. PA-18-2419]|uniref:tetratricopeptide repeat protein n=1 Tax=Nostoc sp. PA-18-2419 TaxID=2575443 RepID=UPI001107ECEE|nr:tetratricopeptide repeat protein [Nostoc sp. PA-18-2419]
MKSIEVFISYHQKDEELREELEKHLATLLREKLITSWHKREIIAGQEFQDEINKYLKRAGLILLLVSPDFIASDYHWTVEVTRALEQNAAGKARVIPVLLRHADWDNPPIDKLSPLPSNRKPIKSWTDRDEAFLEVVKGIRLEVARLVASSNYSPPKDSSANQKPLALKPATDNAPSQPNNQIQTDLTLELPLSIAELTYGTEKKIALEDGSITVTVPSGFSPGKKLRILGKGKLNSITNQRGDLYLKVVSVQKVEVSLEAYQQNLRRYEQKLIEILQWEYPLSNHSREGLKNYQQMLKLRNEDVTQLEEQVTPQEQEKRQDKVTSLINEADRLREAKKFEEAAVKYKAALRLDPNSIIAHSNLGIALRSQGKLEQAIAAFQRALQIDPNDAVANYNLGIALRSQGKWEEVIAAFQRALQIDPNDANAHNNLGDALYEQGKLEEAIAAFQRALQIDPNFAMAHNCMGNALISQGKLEQAIAAYQRALQINPNFAIAHYCLGIALISQGKLEQAIAACQRALQIDPNFAAAHSNLGLALYNQGKLEQAIASYQEALRLDPNIAAAHSNLGVALEKQGKLEEAIAELEIAVRLDPSNTVIRKNLENYKYKKKGFWGSLFG